MTERPAVPPLTGVEHAFLTHEIQSVPGNMQIGGLLRFAGSPPGIEDFRRVEGPRLSAVSRLGLALRRAGRTWKWIPAQADIGRQVNEWVTGEGGLRQAVDEIMALRLMRGAPPWELWLVHGYAADEWASIFKSHHALLDGQSQVKMLLHLCDGETVARPPEGSTAPRRARKRTDVLTFATGFLRYAGKFLPLASRPFTTAGRTGVRTFSWASTDADRLDRLARRYGATRNDVFLFAVATALRAWRHTPWRSGRPCPVWTLVPVDLNARDGGRGLGNRVITLRVQLPCDEPDPVQRLARIVQATADGKDGGQVPVAGAGFRSMPAWLVGAGASAALSRWHVGLIASNIRGPEQMPGYQGMAISEFAPLGFIPHGHPVAAYLTTYDDRVCVSFAVDSSLPTGDELCRWWLRALDELDSPVIEARPVDRSPDSWMSSHDQVARR